MKFSYYSAVFVILFYGSIIPAMAADYTVTGTLEFERDYRTMLSDFNGTGRIAFPKDTHIELVKKNWLGGWDVVVNGVTTNANGSYSITYDTDTTSEFRLRVSIETIKDLPNDYERININGQFIVPAVLNHNWWFETNTFTFADADPANNTLTVHIYVGDTQDSDSGVVNHSITMADMNVNNPLAVAYTEEHMRLMVALLYTIDKAYLDIAQSGKISWLGTTHGQDTDGQLVLCPGGIVGQLSGGAISWPDDFQIHFSDNLDSWTATTVVHEFGHIVHYHTTSWSALDLTGELGGHDYWKETDTKVAYCEGWAEFFEETFVLAYSNIINRTPYIFITGNPWIWAGVESFTEPPSYPTVNTAVFNGTDNSGEIVEGAVAQVFWQLKDNGPAFAARIEPIWAVIRDGATAGNYNSRKTFEDFYDKWMLSSVGPLSPRRQICRDECDKRGIVYSRSKYTKFKAVSTGDAFKAMSDKEWLSAKSTLKAEDMTAADLKCDVVDDAITYVYFQIRLSPNPADPTDWSTVTDSFITQGASWTTFAEDNTPEDDFLGELDANQVPLHNRYYMVMPRARVVKFGETKLALTDNLNAPLLLSKDASDLNTAKWWNEKGILFQVKVDKIAPTVPVDQRKPATNP